VVALKLVLSDGVILVEVESDDVGEVESLLAVQADEFAVNADGGGAGGEAEDAVLAGAGPFADEVFDHQDDVFDGVLGGCKDARGDSNSLLGVEGAGGR
jgi:hypothetical protein